MKKAKRPYHLCTETFSGFYETLEEAKKNYYKWINFYTENKGKYGNENRKIIITKNKGYKTEKIMLMETIENNC